MGLKSYIQNKMHMKALKLYELELSRQQDAYQAFINVQENSSLHEVISLSDASVINDRVQIFQFQDFVIDFEFRKSYDYLICINGDGLIPKCLIKLVETLFDDDPSLNVIYFDEDEIDKNTKKRFNPWFKSEYSLDTILNSLYFGNIVAFRRKTLEQSEFLTDSNPFVNIYKYILSEVVNCNSDPLHIPNVMFHRYFEKDLEDNTMAYTGAEPIFDHIKASAYEKLGVKASFSQDKYGISHARIENHNEKVLIVIPSKDHPDILDRCVNSIVTLSSYKNYKIVVVDNGSTEENKQLYKLMSEKYGFNYIYSLMEFNFSKMCNLGVNSEESDFILLLNDDTEVVTEDWIELLLGAALLKHVGAVGAKLYYPDGETIQHVGITNMTEGPSHKLQRHNDKTSYYHGVNRFDRGVIGVTAACLMVAREKYDLVGGFNESLKVAYNDVYFCFALYSKLLSCVIRNDVVLLHHESLSRGDDHANVEKLKRLKNERIKLYSGFPALYGNDPYYSPYLTGASEEYECVLPFENRNIRPINSIESMPLPMNALNETLIISVDRAEEEILWNDEPCVLIDLHCHVRGLDNADYAFSLYIEKDGQVFMVPVIRRFRPDVIKVLYNENHVELSGFVARIPKRLLRAGDYNIWIMAKSLVSRQILLNKAECTFTVTSSEI